MYDAGMDEKNHHEKSIRKDDVMDRKTETSEYFFTLTSVLITPLRISRSANALLNGVGVLGWALAREALIEGVSNTCGLLDRGLHDSAFLLGVIALVLLLMGVEVMASLLAVPPELLKN